MFNFHRTIPTFANRAAGCMSSNASIAETMMASVWSSSMARERRSIDQENPTDLR